MSGDLPQQYAIKEDFFIETPSEEDLAPPVNTVAVEHSIWGLRRREKLIAKLQEQQKASNLWYERKIQVLQEQINTIESGLDMYLDTVGQTSIATPSGTVIRTRRSHWAYDEKTLGEWLKKNVPDLLTTETIEKIDKSGLKQYVDKTGEVPPGVVVEQRTTISIRRSA